MVQAWEDAKNLLPALLKKIPPDRSPILGCADLTLTVGKLTVGVVGILGCDFQRFPWERRGVLLYVCT